MRKRVIEERPLTIDWDGTRESLEITEAKIEEMFKVDMECIIYNYPYVADDCNKK